MMWKQKMPIVLPPVILYLCLNLGFCFMFPYLNLQAKSLGLTMSEITLVSGMVPFISFPASPIFGYLADRLSYKIVLIFLLLINSILGVAFCFLPEYKEVSKFQVGIESLEDLRNGLDPKKLIQLGEYLFSNQTCRDSLDLTINTIKCDNETLKVDWKIKGYQSQSKNYCESYATDYCLYELVLNRNSSVFCDATVEDIASVDRSGNWHALFWLFVVVRVLWGYTVNPLWNTADAIAARAARSLNIDWAILSFFGNITNILGPLAVGFLLENIDIGKNIFDCIAGKEAKGDYDLSFFCFSGVMASTILIITFMDVQIDANQKSDTQWRNALTWLKQPSAIGFYILLIIGGVFYGALDGFNGVYVTEELNLTEKWFGVSNSVNGLSATVLVLCGGLIHKYVGSMNIVLIGFLLPSLRLTLLGYNRSYEESEVPLEILISSVMECKAFQWVGVVGYANIIAPRGLTATALGFAASAVWVIGVGLGSIISGQVNALVGTRVMMKIFGFSGIGCCVVYGALYHLVIKKMETWPTINEDTNSTTSLNLDIERHLNYYNSIKLDKCSREQTYM